jgi:hypothetical protein
MVKKSKKSTTLDEPAKTILSVLLTEFREKGFGTDELRWGIRSKVNAIPG